MNSVNSGKNLGGHSPQREPDSQLIHAQHPSPIKTVCPGILFDHRDFIMLDYNHKYKRGWLMVYHNANMTIVWSVAVPELSFTTIQLSFRVSLHSTGRQFGVLPWPQKLLLGSNSGQVFCVRLEQVKSCRHRPLATPDLMWAIARAIFGWQLQGTSSTQQTTNHSTTCKLRQHAWHFWASTPDSNIDQLTARLLSMGHVSDALPEIFVSRMPLPTAWCWGELSPMFNVHSALPIVSSDVPLIAVA